MLLLLLVHVVNLLYWRCYFCFALLVLTIHVSPFLMVVDAVLLFIVVVTVVVVIAVLLVVFFLI